MSRTLGAERVNGHVQVRWCNIPCVWEKVRTRELSSAHGKQLHFTPHSGASPWHSQFVLQHGLQLVEAVPNALEGRGVRGVLKLTVVVVVCWEGGREGGRDGELEE